MVFLTVKKTFRFFSPLKKPKKTWFLFLRKKTLRFFNIWSEHLLLKWSHLSERLNYVSFHTSLMQLSLDINFPASFFKRFDRLHFQSHSSDVDVEEKFFLHICGKKRLDWKLRSKREINKLLEWFHSTLRWKGKYQQNWKESSELKIAPKTKNQYSCRRGCQNDNLACGKVNLASD